MGGWSNPNGGKCLTLPYRMHPGAEFSPGVEAFEGFLGAFQRLFGWVGGWVGELNF